MRILDMSAGRRAQWHNKKHPDAIYVDIREDIGGYQGVSGGHMEPCHPDIVCDTRALPFPDGVFDLISFDPPHMHMGKTSKMGAAYAINLIQPESHTMKKNTKKATKPLQPISTAYYEREIAILTKLNMEGVLSNAAYEYKWKVLQKRLNIIPKVR